jgi:hypothetical protein
LRKVSVFSSDFNQNIAFEKLCLRLGSDTRSDAADQTENTYIHNPHFVVRYIKESDGPEETVVILNRLFNNQLIVA